MILHRNQHIFGKPLFCLNRLRTYSFIIHPMITFISVNRFHLLIPCLKDELTNPYSEQKLTKKIRNVSNAFEMHHVFTGTGELVYRSKR